MGGRGIFGLGRGFEGRAFGESRTQHRVWWYCIVLCLRRFATLFHAIRANFVRSDRSLPLCPCVVVIRYVYRPFPNCHSFLPSGRATSIFISCLYLSQLLLHFFGCAYCAVHSLAVLIASGWFSCNPHQYNALTTSPPTAPLSSL